MKNIHLIPTPNPSRLLKTIPKGNLLLAKENIVGSHWENQNIYITSDDEIKERDWCIVNGKPEQILEIQQAENVNYKTKTAWFTNCKKIILTTDEDLIKDGVQPIDDDFLEWFIKNPSCEEVELDSICKCISCGSSVKSSCDYAYKCNPQIFYKIIIPKEEPKQIKCYCGHTTYCDCSPLEEPKQETLEEAAEKYAKQFDNRFWVAATFKEGAKWQQERSYSEEEVIRIIEKSRETGLTAEFLLLTEQFKKK
jgi:hypothetical protein